MNEKELIQKAKVVAEYHGRKIEIRKADKITLYNLNWSEGAKNYYYAMRIDSGAAKAYIPVAPWYEKNEGRTVEIPAGAAVICKAYNGQRCWLTIYVNDGDLK